MQIDTIGGGLECQTSEGVWGLSYRSNQRGATKSNTNRDLYWGDFVAGLEGEGACI